MYYFVSTGMQMKYICRKCGIFFTNNTIDSWQDLRDIQMMTCAGGGTHRLIGVKE